MTETKTKTTETALELKDQTSDEVAEMGSWQGKLAYARELANAGMIPKTYQKNPANVLVAIEYGQALGVDPIVAMNQITVVNGGVSMEAKLMMALARKAGHIVRLEGDEHSATCTIVRADDPGHEAKVTWDERKAKQAGLWGKGHWAQNPQLMLRYRAAAENIRLTCPEVLAGISYTPEEVKEIRSRNVHQPANLGARAPRDAQYYMKALKLSGQQFKAFAERTLGHDVEGWEKMPKSDQRDVLAGLDRWLRDGQDPTMLEDAEVVNEATGEVKAGA